MASGLLFPPAQGMAVLHSDTETTEQGNSLSVPSHRRPLCMRSRTRRRRSSTNSSSLDTKASLSSFTSQSIVSSPNIVIKRRGSLCMNQPVFTFSPKSDVTASKTTKSKTKQKRRIRTFYSNGLWTIDFSKKRRCSQSSNVRRESVYNFPVNPVMPPCGPPSPSPSPLPMMDRQHLSVDMEFGEALSYDSAASNMAANNDLDRNMADDEDDDEFSDLETPDLPTKRDSQFKIVVSAPDCGFDSRMTAKRTRLRFCGSDLDCATDDCGSSDDEEEDESALFLSDNDHGIGIFSSFPGAEQSDSDYLSAQTEDFEDLTICTRRDRNERNIKFRGHETPNYLSVLGPSDMGSDTDCFSSADSIPGTMPPVILPPRFAPMMAR